MCLSVTFRCLDLQTSFLVGLRRIARSTSHVKVIGQGQGEGHNELTKYDDDEIAYFTVR